MDYTGRVMGMERALLSLIFYYLHIYQSKMVPNMEMSVSVCYIRYNSPFSRAGCRSLLFGNEGETATNEGDLSLLEFDTGIRPYIR